MRKIIVTEKNIRSIAGRLKKFFNNPKYGFEDFHNFDCGFKNIKPYYGGGDVSISVDKIDVIRSESGELCILLVHQENVSAERIDVGSIIVFKGGNEIIIQHKWKLTKNFQYQYLVYRLKSMTTEDIENSEHRRWSDRMDCADYGCRN